jgi:phage terminase Nu1 subunit (DNA packaging protein)
MSVTGKEFARQRGVDPSRVSQWKRQGRLVLDADARIDAEASHALLNASLDQAKGMRRDGNVTSSIPAAAAPATGGQQDLLPAGGDRPEPVKPSREENKSYMADKAREQKAVATLAEMKMLQQAGALVPAAGVKKAAAETARHLRNMLLAIPDDIAQILDPSNPARAHKLLTDVIQKALHELSSELEQRAAAAAGAEEREPALL